MAEEKIAYRRFTKQDRHAILDKLRSFFAEDGRIKKAWIFGSFAREEDGPGSDIDIAIEEDKAQKFSYFDLADVQHRLEQMIGRKIDIGFSDGLAPKIAHETALLYEK